MRLHRLLAILLLIESRGRIKAEELAAALETSKRSIYRDIDILAESGIPIIATPGPGGGIQLMAGYTVNLKQLNSDDVINLYLTGMGIYSHGATDSGLKLKNTLLKLEATLPASYRPDIIKAKHRFYYDDTPWWTERVLLPSLEALRLAVWRSYKIRIEYCKINGDITFRELRPYGLVVKKAQWYLIAYCEQVEEIRTFKCERVLEVNSLEETFEIPAGFSLEQQWNKQEMVFKQSCKEQEYYPVTIKMYKRDDKLLEKLEILEDVVQGDPLLLRVNMFSYESACRDIMAVISQITIVDPEELRQFAKEKLTSLLEMY